MCKLQHRCKKFKLTILRMYITVALHRETQELEEGVHRLEDELASVRRQSRRALARAVSAEIEADKVPVLEQQLSRTKTNLEEQIHMKDQARIAAEQQLQQTKTNLEKQIHMRDQARIAAEQQLQQTKAALEYERHMKSQAERQFSETSASL